MKRPSLRFGYRQFRWAYLIGLHLFVVALLVFPNGVQRLNRYWNQDPSVMDEYQGMVGAQAVVCAGLPEGVVIFLGDSRMRGLPVRDVVSDLAINLSIGGDTTRGLLGRISRYPRLETASRIVLGVGINDLSHFADEELVANYRSLLEGFNSRGPKVVVTAILPVNESKYRQANASYLSGHKVTNARIDRVNRAIAQICERYPNVAFIDVNAAVVAADGNLRDGYSADGLHLTVAGNAAWAAALRKKLAESVGN